MQVMCIAGEKPLGDGMKAVKVEGTSPFMRPHWSE
jgi:hypothetical protein